MKQKIHLNIVPKWTYIYDLNDLMYVKIQVPYSL